MKPTLFATLLLLALGCGREPLPKRDPVGEPFPAAVGESLEGETVRIPDEFSGEPALFLLGYVQKAQFDADRWLLGLLEADLALRIVEIPTLEGFVPGLIRGTIDRGMRGGIPAEDWGSVVTVYGERAGEILAFTGSDEPQNVRVVLLDAAGTVRWFHDDGYSAGKLLELERALLGLDRDAGGAPPIRTSTVRHYEIDGLDERPSRDRLERLVTETFAGDGRKLREEARDATGAMIHTFTLLYDEGERPTGMAAFYAEDGIVPSLETFTYGADGRRREITYLKADGTMTSQAEYLLDERGLNIERRYMRADSTVYGVDTEDYDDSGDSLGWTFERIDGSQRVVHEFRYLDYDEAGSWTRRILVRDGRPVSLQVRELVYGR